MRRDQVDSAPDGLKADQVASDVTRAREILGEPDQDYFADGVTEDPIGALSQISTLRVPSHRSELHFKGTTEPLPDRMEETLFGG